MFSGGHAAVIVNSNQSYAKKMKSMVNNESCSDVVFLLDNDDRVYASRSLLIGQSQYFQAMFRSGMRESKENEIHIKGCPKNVLLMFLQYLYTNEFDVCELADAVQLCVLADKYQEPSLYNRCFNIVENGLSNKNVVTFLVESDSL